jgi:hypothetical protein
MKDTHIWTPTLGKQRALWLSAAGAAVLATVTAITVALATGRASTRPAETQRPAQTSAHTAATCAPDDTRPIGPGGEGVPACLQQRPNRAPRPS